MMMKPAVAAYNHSNNRSLKPLLHPPSYIVYNDIRFLIIDTPSISNMSRYIKVKHFLFRRIEKEEFITNSV